MYRPRNYDERFTGPRRSREALANSLNLPAVMLVDDLTPERLYSALIDLGHTFPHPPDHYGVGLTLGNAELKPADLIQSFTAFSRLNSWVKARWIKNDKIQKFDNPISSESSYLVTDILKDPKARMEAFGERTALDVPFEMAAKTGTSTDYRDNWSVAWTSEHVVLTWVGNHNQQPMKRVSGITGAAPLTRMAMLKIYEKKYPSPFILPAPPKIFPICALSGEYAGAHCPRVLEEKFFANTPTQKCDWHQLVDIPMCGKHVLVHYPENFQSWAYEHGRDTESQLKQICPESTETYQIIVQDRVQLTYPLNGAIFAIDPDLPRESQRLPLKMSGGLKGIEWEVNGARFIPTKNDGTFDWPLERGKHVIRLISENQIQEQVEIVVR
jgi:penicillin-binding protein 1C